MGAPIAVERVVERLGDRTLLAGIDLRVGEGEIVGLLGPNGAGKSTTLSILATLLVPDEGRVRILLVAGLASSREAVLPIGSIFIVAMAAVGGCWLPIDLEPPWMRRAALALPTTWAMAAYNDLMIRRQGADAAIRPALVLAAHGATYLLAGLALFARRLRRGA